MIERLTYPTLLPGICPALVDKARGSEADIQSDCLEQQARYHEDGLGDRDDEVPSSAHNARDLALICTLWIYTHERL